MQIACPNCGENTLRDPKAHSYAGTRCDRCGAEFDAVNGELTPAVPGMVAAGSASAAQNGDTEEAR